MGYVDHRIKGKNHRFPCTHTNGLAVICMGRCLRVASFHDKDMVEGALVPNVPTASYFSAL